jgi:hypothetical protein
MNYFSILLALSTACIDSKNKIHDYFSNFCKAQKTNLLKKQLDTSISSKIQRAHMFRSQNQANKTKYKKSKNILKYKEP